MDGEVGGQYVKLALLLFEVSSCCVFGKCLFLRSYLTVLSEIGVPFNIILHQPRNKTLDLYFTSVASSGSHMSSTHLITQNYFSKLTSHNALMRAHITRQHIPRLLILPITLINLEVLLEVGLGTSFPAISAATSKSSGGSTEQHGKVF
jgi:hypothetical protein